VQTKIGRHKVALARHDRIPLNYTTAREVPTHSILIMDDEEIVRTLAATMFQYLGYAVTTCATGEEAIEFYKHAMSSGTSYLAVVLDLTIHGGMGGRDAAGQILRLDPGAMLIVSSGYSNDPVMGNHTSYGFHSMLPKPYRLADLANVLAAMFPKGEEPRTQVPSDFPVISAPEV
jgi:two-component system, cell cycle sensor histidine kinase and response regulator CckA